MIPLGILAAASPRAPGDPYRSSVVAHLHMDGSNGSTSFPDTTGRTWTPNANATVTTSNSKFGGASADFPSASLAYLETAGSDDFNFGSGDFTIEGWVYLTGSLPGAGNYRFIASRDDIQTTSTRGWRLLVSGDISGKLSFAATVSGVNYVVSDPAAFPLNSWQYVKVIRTGGFLRLYRGSNSGDYGEVGSTAITGSIQSQTMAPLIGTGRSTSTPVVQWRWQGQMDEMRITKGVARTDGIPEAPFPNS